MKHKRGSRVAVVTFLLLSFLMLFACDGKTNSQKDPPDSRATYTVGTSRTFSPYAYEDGTGTLTGYDVEVLREVDRRLSNVAFEFETSDFDSLFAGLDENRLDLITHQLGKNEQREAKYLYAGEPFGFTSMSIVTRPQDNTINTVEDLQGRDVLVTGSGTPAVWLTDYNVTVENKVNLVYYEGDWIQGMQQLAEGIGDATIAPSVNVSRAIDELALDVRKVRLPLYTVDVFFIFRPDRGALRDQVDLMILEMREDGTLSRLSHQFLDGDYSSPGR